MQSCLQASTAEPKVSYSTVVKGTIAMESTTRTPSAIARSTLISTTDAPRPSNQQRNAAYKEPFKLVPVMPPKKEDITKKTLAVANPSKIINAVPKKVEIEK